MKRRLSVFVATAIAMAVALVMGIGAKPASAETTYTAIGGSTSISKHLVVAASSNIPDIEFSYTITRSERIAPTTNTIEILKSNAAATIGTAQFSNSMTARTTLGKPGDSAATDFKYATAQILVTFPDSSFTKPGVYRYYIREDNGSQVGVTYDSRTLYLDVFVNQGESEGTLVIPADGFVLHGTAEASISTDSTGWNHSGTKSIGFVNELIQHDFTVSKTIAGNQGDKTKQFTFTLSITNAIPGTYTLDSGNMPENTPNSITVGTDGTFTRTFDLTNGSSLKVTGLNNGASCTVSEDNQDYTASYQIDSGGTLSGNNSGPIRITSNRTVAFTNTREGTIPTGVIVTVAPFAIGIMLSGALIVYLVTKRRNDYV